MDIAKKAIEKVEDAVMAAGHALPGFDQSAGTILVTCANGVVGHRVALRLLKAGYPSVRLGVHDSEEEKVVELVELGAETVEFAWEKENSYALALDGAKSVFVCLDVVEGWEEKFPLFLEACHQAKIKHIVKLSFYHAMKSEYDGMLNFVNMKPAEDAFSDVPLVHMQGYCDLRLVKSRIDYTILFASHLMSNPLRYQAETIRNDKKFYGASGGKGVNYVSPNDVAEVAVRSLLAMKDHSRTGYTLTGPKAITDKEVADLLSIQLKETITFVDQLPPGADPSVVALEKIKASGKEESVAFLSKDVEKVCGHPPESYEDYLLDKDDMTLKELAAYIPTMEEVVMMDDGGVEA